jgi:fumarate reductase (CoM/CoB) subunit A
MVMQTQCEELATDVLVVGSGAAALRAALEAEAGGARVLVVIKGEFRRSGATFHSVAEVGAFNVPDDAAHQDDSPDVFLADILAAAQGMSDPRLSAIVANEAGEALSFLERYGVHFERQGNDYLVFRACFSSRPRSHVIKDHFKPIVKALGQEATRRGIAVHDRLMVTDLLVADGQCAGVRGITADGTPVVIRAKATILTTGGASQLFATNLYPSDITGDGYAMAHRAGARLVNMEFMQAGVSVVSPFINLFGNYLWAAAPRLTDRDGDEFVRDYLPPGLALEEVIATKERHFPFSASDVSRYIEISIQKAINEGRGTPQGGVWMDLIDRDFGEILKDPQGSMARMWPVTYAWYKEKGIDLYHDPIQIACSAHAINGGILIDEDGQSNLKGLFAAGEVAGGPHGADRLGGNMAVTCQIFGRRAGREAARRAAGMDLLPAPDAPAEAAEGLSRFARRGSADLADLRARLQREANRSLLVVRTGESLGRFASLCAEIRETLATDAAIDGPTDLVSALELDNLCEVGGLIAKAASLRTESRGGHYREDFPDKDPAQEQAIVFDRAVDGGIFRTRLGTASA